MRSKRLLLLTGLVLSLLQVRADWPFGKGRKIMFPSVSYFSSQRNFDSKGRNVSLGTDNAFASTSYSLFFGYGLGRNLDISANIPFVSQTLKTPGGKLPNSGLGDASFGLAYHFPSEDLKSFFTVKTGLMLPMYAGQSTPSLGLGNNALSLGANYSFNPLEGVFCVADFSHVRYFADDGTGPNQNIYSVTLGKGLNEFHLFTVNFTHFQSSSVNKNFSIDLPLNKDFSYGKISVGYGRRTSRTIMPYLQLFYTPYGRNAGVSYGASLSIISKLPL
jgi:hypothetical protein